MEREELTRIKERIAKLLAMAADASSPNEAAIAAQRARALMDKYQLDEYDISEAAPQEFSEDDVTRAYASLPFHVDVLAVAVAKYNDCQCVLRQGKMDHRMEGKARLNERDGRGTKPHGVIVRFRGYKNDVELAKQMFDRLLENVDKLCKAYMQANHPGRYNVRIGGDYKASCVSAVREKFDAMTVEREQLTYSSGTALVVVKAKQVEVEFGKAEYISKSKAVAKNLARDDYVASAKARTAGYVDGQKIEITKRLDD